MVDEDFLEKQLNSTKGMFTLLPSLSSGYRTLILILIRAAAAFDPAPIPVVSNHRSFFWFVFQRDR